ncbi:uncharacterized protein LOC121872430 isoform X2 [Homarus americanus]|uniref:uncharacterized protein LOC121872430 isoform X2 n=1 Tax=Homarus americanus TaxID=6706 RepID=UPI001C47C5A6|nr:uncharacterized protein LOC121872430 isoform X2 [Homarus americanus]
MENGPLPETREVLCEHLLAKVRYLNPALADQVTDMLVVNISNKEIIDLLTSDAFLEENVEKIVASISEPDSELRESLGMSLFQAVSVLESELCAQVTGMLLELPIPTVTRLLSDVEALKEAVNKARNEYLRFVKGGDHTTGVPSAPPVPLSNEKEELGEVIYEKIVSKYPSEAAKLTGMLLQMDYKDLVPCGRSALPPGRHYPSERHNTW